MHSFAQSVDRWSRAWQYIASPRAAASYVGPIGYRNLGDEALLQAARECFDPLPVVTKVGSHRSLVRQAQDRKRHDIVILGAGSLIGNHPPFERFREELAKARRGLVFGSGVSRPVLSGKVPEWLLRWGEVLRPLTYVGVRGARSAATLARVGVDAEVIGDPICWFSQDASFWQPRKKVMGMNIGRPNGRMYGSEALLERRFVEYASAMTAQGWHIEFFCIWPGDLAMTQRVAQAARIEEPIIHCIYEDAHEYLERVRCMKVFVGFKRPAVALAMAANVPSMMIEYRPACRDFAEVMGLQDYAVRSDDMRLTHMLRLTDRLDAAGPEVSHEIRSAMAPYQRRLQRLKERALPVAA